MENTVKQQVDPINIKIMDVDKFVSEHRCKEVTTSFIRENSSNEFHHEGLFSEQIFGQIGTPDRIINFGYISLNTTILHPVIYRNIIKLKQFYGDILANKQYAKWNDQTKEFDRCGMDDDDADTGYTFFMKHVKELKFNKNESITHNEKIDVYLQNLDNLTITKCLVIPAGLRDMRVEDGKPEKDSINKIYTSLLAIAKAIPARNGNNPVYNGHRFTIQKKVNEIYEYLFEMIQGKFGVFQRKYGSRALALGTRNVISTTNMNAESPYAGTFFCIDEMKVPLFQCANMFMPLVTYYVKMLFFADVFNVSSDQVAVIDPKTLALRYKPIKEDEKAKFLSSDGVRDIVKLFRDEDFRNNYVTVYTEDNEEYWLYLVYDSGDGTIIIGRSEEDLKSACKAYGTLYNKEYVHPLTYLEMLYIAVQKATESRNGLVCRYPAIEISSEIPCKIHVFTTNPGRTVTLRNSKNVNIGTVLPEYPIFGKDMTDSMIPHPSLLGGLGAD